MSKNIVLIGAGGHCKSVLDTLKVLKNYDKIVVIGKQEEVGKNILNIICVGVDKDLCLLFKNGFTDAFVVLGLDTKRRIDKFKELKSIGFNIPNIVDISAKVSEHVVLSEGLFIGKNAVINAGVKLGDGTIINTGSIIEHDCLIEDFVSIAPGVVICGGCTIGAGSQVGAGAIIKNNIKIGTNSIIGAGSVVVKDIDDNTIAFGNPCKKVKDNIEEGVLNDREIRSNWNGG